MDILSIVAVAVISAVVCLLLKQYKPEYAVVTSLACGVLIFSLVLNAITPATDMLTELLEKASIKGEYLFAILKAIGICYVTQLAADTCRDAEQTAAAAKVELGGRLAIVLLSLPLFKNLIDTAFTLINSGG